MVRKGCHAVPPTLPRERAITVTSGFGSAGLKGTEGDGKITAGIGVVAGLLALFGLSSGKRGNVVFAGVLAIGGAAMSLFEWQNVSSKINDLGDNQFVRASVGTGIWVMLAGFVVAAICILKSAPADPLNAYMVPVPSPIQARLATGAPAGWHVDPYARHQLRYWNGDTWTIHVSDSGIPSTDVAVS